MTRKLCSGNQSIQIRINFGAVHDRIPCLRQRVENVASIQRPRSIKRRRPLLGRASTIFRNNSDDLLFHLHTVFLFDLNLFVMESFRRLKWKTEGLDKRERRKEHSGTDKSSKIQLSSLARLLTESTCKPQQKPPKQNSRIHLKRPCHQDALSVSLSLPSACVARQRHLSTAENLFHV